MTPTPSRAPLRVAIVEDQPLYRSMLVQLLDADPRTTVAVEASGAAEARRRIIPGTVDVAILDIELSDGNGVGLGVSLRRAAPELGVLLLSSQDVMELLLDLPPDVRRGWSYLSKTTSTSAASLFTAIEATAAGQTVLDPELIGRSVPRAGSALAGLSQRQFQVLSLVAEGLSNAGIAERLGLSSRSVENHLNAVYSALDLPVGHNSRVSAVLRLIEETSRYA